MVRSASNTPDTDEMLSGRSAASPAVALSPAPILSVPSFRGGDEQPTPPPDTVQDYGESVTLNVSKYEELATKESAEEGAVQEVEETIIPAAAAQHHDNVEEEQRAKERGSEENENVEEEIVKEQVSKHDAASAWGPEVVVPVPLQREATMVPVISPIKPPLAEAISTSPPGNEPLSPATPKSNNPFASPAVFSSASTRPSTNPFAKPGSPSKNPFASPPPPPSTASAPALDAAQLASVWRAVGRASWSAVEQHTVPVDGRIARASVWLQVEAVMRKSVPVA